jgi:hypothetical protein
MSTQIKYQLIEEGKLARSGSSFRKYKGINAQGDTVNVRQWAEQLVAAGGDAATAAARSLTVLLAAAPYQAFFFETPPITAGQQSLEFVLVDAPALDRRFTRRPDRAAFAERFADAKSDWGVVFPNLSGDATLIAPKPISKNLNCYPHLASFVRSGPSAQVEEVWKLTARTLLTRLNDHSQAIWLSTSGLGVGWLHFRLDETPKYYTYDPYKVEQQTS